MKKKWNQPVVKKAGEVNLAKRLGADLNKLEDRRLYQRVYMKLYRHMDLALGEMDKVIEEELKRIEHRNR